MGMVFCRGCGKEIHASAPTCPHCGATQSLKTTTANTIPEGIRGWSWGAFLLSWIWAISNKTWIGLLALIPFFGLIMVIVLGFKGREWAWENNQWDSVEHFNRVQKKWSFWGVIIIVVPLVIGILVAIAIPAYQGYQRRAQEMAEANQSEATPQPQQTTSTPQAAQPNQDTSHRSGIYEWKSGWGQGVTEYSANDGNGNELYIACPDSEGAVSAIATIGGVGYSSNMEKFDVIVDGETYSNPFNTGCRVCANNFEPFWAALRKANNIKVFAAGKSAVIPTKNIGKILPAFSSKENGCRVAE